MVDDWVGGVGKWTAPSVGNSDTGCASLGSCVGPRSSNWAVDPSWRPRAVASGLVVGVESGSCEEDSTSVERGVGGGGDVLEGPEGGAEDSSGASMRARRKNLSKRDVSMDPISSSRSAWI